LFESNTNTFGSAPGRDIGFVEALRWYALGGHTFAGVMEMAGIYKIGNGGMTALASAILEEYTGDRLFSTAVSAIRNTSRGAEVTSVHGQKFTAKALISTIPL
jgi:lysyl oxidase-like protein 2/3/4